MAPDASFHFLGPPPTAASALATHCEPLRAWFHERFDPPTTAQRLAWQALTAEENLLLSSPTGSGKTLAAFLPIIDHLMTGSCSDGVRCLYVAPLKALVADAGRNLRACLEEVPCPLIGVGARTGDSSPRERRELRLRPPDILLTTPESLAILLSQARSAELFRNLRWIVIDEVHAFAGNKRGADLSLSLERLSALTADEPQRIGLSATCTPLTVAARFLVGVGRSCAIARVADHVPMELTIEPLAEEARPLAEEARPRAFVTRLLDRLEPELDAHQTTLVFTNVRSLAERLGWALRRRFPDLAIGVHHSSIAAARRRRVERQLKRGELRVVVTSTSLELGIDIGSVDAVVLVHPPGGVVRLLQRVGRAGHAPGRPRRGLILTATPAELLDAAVTGASGQAGQCEPLRVPAQPLDVLCQQLVGMAAQRPWLTDEAFELVRRAWPFRDLARHDFDDCLDYLCGVQRDGRTWLPARLRRDGDEFRITDARTARLLRRNVGTILAEETRAVCLASGDGPFAVGHVDEAFADRLQPGDRFLLDGRCLEFRQVEGTTLVVEEVMGRPATPRWAGGGWPLAAELAHRLYVLRIQVAEALREGSDVLERLLRTDYNLGDAATATLVEFFELQECVSEIPDATTCLVEVVVGAGGLDYYIHTPLNRAANDALARVLVRRLVRDRGRTALSMVADLGFLVAIEGEPLRSAEILDLLTVANFASDLNAAVADSVSLRERFRCVATTALMVLRNPLGKKKRVGGRDWAERRLFEQVSDANPDFVLLRQARCELHDTVIDAAAAQKYLEEMPRRVLRSRRLTQPSPFAQGWTQATAGAIERTESPAEALLRLHAALMG
jgi:ATP-dependent Lhr-like helicase